MTSADFRLSADQEALRASARELLSRECPPSLARDRYDHPGARADTLWRHVIASGWTGITVPQSAGGLGLSVVELCLVLEECGRVLAPVPLWETAGLLVPLLRAAGDERALAQVADGASGTAVTSDGIAPEAHAVDLLASGGTAGLAVRPATGEPLDSLDRTRVLCRVAGSAPDVPDATEEAVVALCAQTLGAARWVLDTTVAYVRTREQFGVPVGSFQAVQHKLADVLVGLERATAATYYAAMCVAADDADRHRAVAVAKACSGDASRQAARDGVQLHGGIGFTWEHDLHLYVRRIYADEPLLGGSSVHRERLAELLAL